MHWHIMGWSDSHSVNGVTDRHQSGKTSPETLLRKLASGPPARTIPDLAN